MNFFVDIGEIIIYIVIKELIINKLLKEKRINIYRGLNNSKVRQYSMNSLTKIPYDAMFEKEHRKRIEKTIEELKNQLEENNSYLAVLEIMKMNSWEEFDISDEIGLMNSDRYCSFIGTKEEYENLLKRI